MDSIVLLSIILSVAGVVIPIVVSIIIAIMQRSKKEISYTVEAKIPLLTVRDEIKDKVQILFDGKQTSNTSLIVLNIQNSGNVPILPEDYIEPVKFDFGKKTEILTANIIKTYPESIADKITLVSNKNELAIKPSLLNKKYSFKVKIIASQFEGTIKGNSLIAGIDKIKEITNDRNRPLRSLQKLAIFAVIMSSLNGIVYSFSSPEAELIPNVFAPFISKSSLNMFDILLFSITILFTICYFILPILHKRMNKVLDKTEFSEKEYSTLFTIDK